MEIPENPKEPEKFDYYFVVRLPDGTELIEESLLKYVKLTEPTIGFTESLYNSIFVYDTLTIKRSEGAHLLYSAAFVQAYKDEESRGTLRFINNYRKSNLTLKPTDDKKGPFSNFFFRVNSEYQVKIVLPNYRNQISIGLQGELFTVDQIKTRIPEVTGLEVNDWKNLTFWIDLRKFIISYKDSYKPYPDTIEWVETMIKECEKGMGEYLQRNLRNYAIANIRQSRILSIN